MLNKYYMSVALPVYIVQNTTCFKLHRFESKSRMSCLTTNHAIPSVAYSIANK